MIKVMISNDFVISRTSEIIELEDIFMIMSVHAFM